MRYLTFERFLGISPLNRCLRKKGPVIKSAGPFFCMNTISFTICPLASSVITNQIMMKFRVITPDTVLN